MAPDTTLISGYQKSGPSKQFKIEEFEFKCDESEYDGLSSDCAQGVQQLMGMAGAQQGQAVNAEGFEIARNWLWNQRELKQSCLLKASEGNSRITLLKAVKHSCTSPLMRCRGSRGVEVLHAPGWHFHPGKSSMIKGCLFCNLFLRLWSFHQSKLCL